MLTIINNRFRYARGAPIYWVIQRAQQHNKELDPMTANAARGPRRGSTQENTSQIVERLNGAFIYLMDRFEVANQRRELLTLDDGALKDIGVTRADADLEGHRSFWDISGRSQEPKSRHAKASNIFDRFTGGQSGIGHHGLNA